LTPCLSFLPWILGNQLEQQNRKGSKPQDLILSPGK